MAARLLLDAGCRNVLNLWRFLPRPYALPMTGTRNLIGLWRKMGHLSKTIEMAWNMMEYDYYCRIMEQYMDIYRDIDGVFTTDIRSLYCLNIANQRGVKVPEKLHIVGYDAVDMTRLLPPSLPA